MLAAEAPVARRAPPRHRSTRHQRWRQRRQGLCEARPRAASASAGPSAMRVVRGRRRIGASSARKRPSPCLPVTPSQDRATRAAHQMPQPSRCRPDQADRRRGYRSPGATRTFTRGATTSPVAAAWSWLDASGGVEAGDGIGVVVGAGSGATRVVATVADGMGVDVTSTVRKAAGTDSSSSPVHGAEHDGEQDRDPRGVTHTTIIGTGSGGVGAELPQMGGRVGLTLGEQRPGGAAAYAARRCSSTLPSRSATASPRATSTSSCPITSVIACARRDSGRCGNSRPTTP